MFKLCLLLLSVAITVDAIGQLCHNEVEFEVPEAYRHMKYDADAPLMKADRGTRVAFIGDQGLRSYSQNILTMVKNWIGSSSNGFLVIQGDFDYKDSPSSWIQQIDRYLGTSIPMFASVGNHDADHGQFSNYAREYRRRLERTGHAKYCTGTYLDGEYCSYKGIDFVLSPVGTRGSSSSATRYIESSLAKSRNKWRFCSWHKNQKRMNVGGKGDSTGWDVYRACRKGGAFVVVGHEHSYSRTKTMRNFESQSVMFSTTSTVEVGSGDRSFMFVNGVGGYDVRSYKDGKERNSWWAKTLASGQVRAGVVMCEFNPGNVSRANCNFKNYKGTTMDTFTIKNRNSKQMVGAQDEPRVCPQSDFVEYTINSGEKDVQVDHTTGRVIAADSEALIFSATMFDDVLTPSVVKLSFDIDIADRLEFFESTYLQLYGTTPNGDEGETIIEISAREGGPVLTWNNANADDGFETHEVWDSPDLSEIVLDAIEHGATDVLTLTLTSYGQELHTAASYNYSPCQAPALAVVYGCGL